MFCYEIYSKYIFMFHGQCLAPMTKHYPDKTKKQFFFKV